MRKLILTLLTAVALTLGTTAASAQTEPKTVIHLVTVTWKTSATPEQIQAAINGVKALPKQYPGMTRVWTKPLKAHGENAGTTFAMEFASEEALKGYTDSPAQKEWYKTYIPIREKSTAYDVTN